jgi:hypothetical protein
VREVAEGLLLEPFIADAAEWFAELDRVRGGYFFLTSEDEDLD